MPPPSKWTEINGLHSVAKPSPAVERPPGTESEFYGPIAFEISWLTR